MNRVKRRHEELREDAINSELEALVALALLPPQGVEPAMVSAAQAHGWMVNTANAVAQRTELATAEEILEGVQITDRPGWLRKHVAARQATFGQSLSHECWESPSQWAGKGSLLDYANREIQKHGFSHNAVFDSAWQDRKAAHSVVFSSFPLAKQPLLVVDNLEPTASAESGPSFEDTARLAEAQFTHAQLVGSPWLGDTVIELERAYSTYGNDTLLPLMAIEYLRKVDARFRARLVCGDMELSPLVGPPRQAQALFKELNNIEPESATQVLDWVWRQGQRYLPDEPVVLNHTPMTKTWWRVVSNASSREGNSRL